MRGSRFLFCSALVALAASGCARRSGARDIAFDDTRPDWSGYGFIEMVPPLRLPTTAEGNDDVRVWLKLPAGGKLSARWLADQGRYVLDYPAGTVAARVESRDGTIADVRGTRLKTGGAEQFFVYRPAGKRLRGVSWPRGDPTAQYEATERLASLAPTSQAAAHVRRQNDCAGCHVHTRAPNDRPDAHGVANRGTDARGLFQVQTVLEDRAPLETYKPRDSNLGSPFVTVHCGDEPALVEDGGANRRARCADGRIPVGELDLKAALAADDPHAKRVCDARRALAPHLDPSAREAFAGSLRECGIESKGAL